jgi:hypothetical protein
MERTPVERSQPVIGYNFLKGMKNISPLYDDWWCLVGEVARFKGES